MTQMEGYHGTCYSCVPNILKNGYICKKNDGHWLGQGIYFYDDAYLAVYWAKLETSISKYSMDKPAVLISLIETEESAVLDLSKIEQYNAFIDYFYDFQKALSVHFPDLSITFPSAKQLRCAVFDSYKKENNIDVIIALFVKEAPKYVSKIRLDKKILKSISFPFCEKQVCVTSNKSIKETRLYTKAI